MISTAASVLTYISVCLSLIHHPYHYYLHFTMQSMTEHGVSQGPKADQWQYLFHVQLLGQNGGPEKAAIKVSILWKTGIQKLH